MPSPPNRPWHRRLAGLGLVAAIGMAGSSIAAERPLIILFGGYGATEADMRIWTQAAAQDPVYGGIFDFEGVAYPNDAGSNVLRAVAAAEPVLAAIADRLRAMPDRRVVVAGHSSGAALAVSTVSRVGERDTIKLISLDAGINTEAPPAPGFFPITRLECWSAASDGMVSFGYKRAQALCKDNFFVLRTARCTTPICLHYSLINRTPAAGLTFKQSRVLDNGVSGGYADFAVNLDWLAHAR